MLAREPRSDVRALARATGIEDKTVRAVLRELEAEGYIRRERRGDLTLTLIDRAKPLRHPVERHHPVGRLLDAVESPADVLRDWVAAKD